MPRFVLLYHECPPGYERPSHWDLMLESGDNLRTWALAELPRLWQAAQLQTAASHPNCPALSGRHSVDAQQLGDHRRAYLELEGPLSGNRGGVTRIDTGIFTSLARSTRDWRIELTGRCLHVKLILSQFGPNGKDWTLTCDADR